MSKTILIYRHAKSDWSAAYGSDHDRPLAKRGIKGAKKMGKWLGRMGEVPELVITSTALRARQTVELSALEGNWECEIREDEKLYYESTSEIFEIIKALPDKYSSVMLVGHEPKCSLLASSLTGREDIVFKTATMIRIDFDIKSWGEVNTGKGKLAWLQQPSLLKK